jgi:hypothetical protein
MNTTTGVYLALGSTPPVVAVIAARNLSAALGLLLVGLAAFIAREIRLGLRERRDDDTARYMFDKCQDSAAAFEHYARVLRTREGPP